MTISEIEIKIRKTSYLVIACLNSINLSIGVAESVTGGGFAFNLTDVPGVSAVFRGGVVAYSESLKISQLEVNKETIDTKGIVSKEVAIEMAKGIRKFCGSDIALGVTGYAGPSGGDRFAPLGTVFWGYVDGKSEDFLQLKLSGDRYKIRQMAILHGLDYILKKLR